MKFNRSKTILNRAKKVIPNSCQTLSKGYKMFIEGDFPLFISRAKGCYMWDVDGNKYIDYTCALAPVILGYNFKEVDESIIKQLKKGITFSLPHEIEADLAEELVSIIPGAEMVRFAKNGADVTSAAVRIARAYTGRDIILKCGYHGGQDWYLITQPPQDLGVPKAMKKLIDVFAYNNIKSLKDKFKKHKGKVAAVIMEPIPLDTPKKGYLEEVKKITKKNGAILIFDEIVTGFRMSLGGAQEYYNVIPDLSCFGKAMANGMPISCLVGKKEIMKKTENVFLSTTFGGEILSIAAALTTINYIKEHKVIEHTQRMGTMLYSGINDLIKKYGIKARLIGQEFKFKFIFENHDGSESNIKKLFFLQQAVYKGVFFGLVTTFNYSHKEKEIKYSLKVAEEIFKKIRGYNDDEEKIKKLIKGKIPINNFIRDQR